MAGAGGFDREKAIELAVNTIQKQFGKGAIMRLGDGTSPQDDIDVISTGSIGLDVALGTGGLPRVQAAPGCGGWSLPRWCRRGHRCGSL